MAYVSRTITALWPSVFFTTRGDASFSARSPTASSQSAVIRTVLVQLFREAPGLLEQLLGQAKLIDLPRHDAVSAAPESIGDAMPRELRCDAVFRFDSRG